MKENKYDNKKFYEQYSQMSRSVYGLQGAGEWHALKQIMPDFIGKRVLDLGCGFGWHCQYAAEYGAKSVLGIDISKNMLDEAISKNKYPSVVEYRLMPIEDFEYLPGSFDVVISSLAFHYIESFEDICKKVSCCLSDRGTFIFSVEHPVFTAYGNQDWYYDKEGNRLHWAVDRYFEEGRRAAVFLGEEVTKYHRSLTSYINSLLKNGFEITELIEPEPEKELLESVPEMKDELRRPMMLIISAIRR